MWYLAIVIAQCITQSANYVSSFKLMPEFDTFPTADTYILEPLNLRAPPVHRRSELKIGQYAPLHNIHHEKEHKPKKATTRTTESITKEKKKQEKLEPRVDGKNEADCYTTNNKKANHIVGTFETVSRSPGYNAVYRLNGRMNQNGGSVGFKRVLDNNWRAQELSSEVNRVFENPITEKKIEEKVEFNVQYQNPPSSNNTNTENKERVMVEYIPTPSIIRPYILNVDARPKNYNLPILVHHLFGTNNKHKVHMNIARVYIPSGVQKKSQIFAGAYALDSKEYGEEMI